MPEIKYKHVVSFSSEDKVHKAENLIEPETYRKWKCASPGEKNATVVLQFEKASKIHSIDIGNESSAFVEVLVGRSSDSINDFQVILVASSFMSPLESRNGTHMNRVRMFGPEKLSQNVKDEKWDCVQIVCTQPFNKNISYGLSFLKFHSPPEKADEVQKRSETASTTKLGAFRVKSDDENEDLLEVGSLFGKQKDLPPEKQSSQNKNTPSYAATVLALSGMTNTSPKDNTLKRKIDSPDISKNGPPVKKNSNKSNSDFIVYKPVGVVSEKKKENPSSPASSKNTITNKIVTSKNTPESTSTPNTPSTSKTAQPVRKKIPFNKIMEKVVFVLSGFVNPLRSQIRDKALEMGAKYTGDWDKSCTHLICAFFNTPKYIQVRAQGGIVVTKEWILDCHKKKTLLPWRDYKLGTYDQDTSGEEETESELDESPVHLKNTKGLKKDPPATDKGFKFNGLKSPNTKEVSTEHQPQAIGMKLCHESGSETEDSDALNDYIADTEKDSDSGGNTEDEIEKVEKKLKRAKSKVEELTEKPNVDNLPLPELPNLFKQKHFFLFGEFPGSRYHEIKRYIIAYNGVVEDYMSDDIKYVISDEKWDNNFEDALAANEDLIFIKSLWIYKCHEAGKLMPYQPFIITPDT